MSGVATLVASVAAAFSLGSNPLACDPGAANPGASTAARLGYASQCATAAGTILYVERVDPDGDGDAHFVLLGDESITAPGISVIDVARELRPRPLPGPGDLLAAVGPVYSGSYGQRQIQAAQVSFARATR